MRRDLHGGHDAARGRIAHRRHREEPGPGARDDGPAARGGDGLGRRPLQRRAGRGDDGAVQVAHDHVEVEIGVKLLQARDERPAIPEPLAGQRGHVARDALADLAREAAASADGEDHADRRAHHQQRDHEMQVDTRAKPHRPVPGRTRA